MKLEDVKKSIELLGAWGKLHGRDEPVQVVACNNGFDVAYLSSQADNETLRDFAEFYLDAPDEFIVAGAYGELTYCYLNDANFTLEEAE